MLAFWDRIRHLFSGPQLPWMIVWLGLATLIVGLIVLTRTKWGQSHPLRKCAALSLLVHLLLAAYATTVEIVTVGAPDGNSDRGSVSVTLVDDPTFIPATTDPSQTTPKTAAAEPIWNQLLPGAAAVPSTLAMSRPDTAAETTQPQPRLERELSEPAKPLLEKPAAEPADASHAEQSTDQAHVPAAKPAAPIDAPAPLRPQPATASVVPAPTAVDRQPLTLPDAAPPSGQQSGPHSGAPDGALTGRAAHAQSPSADTLIAPAELPSVGDQLAGDNKTVRPAPAALVPLSPVAEIQSVPGSSTASQTKIGSASIARQSLTDGTGGNSTAARLVSSGAKPPGPESTLVVLPVTATSGGESHGTTSPVPAPDIYKDRTASDRAAVLKRRGGSPETEAAVQAALRWLVQHQEADGHWDAEKNGAGRELTVLGHDRSGAGARAHTATTALALLALLGSGNTHRDGPYARNVQHGLEYLLKVQGRDGNLGGQAEMFAFMYSHGMASFALSEDYAMTHDKRLEEPLRAAIGYTIAAQHPTTGGWRYQIHETGDTSQLGWQLMALKSAELGGLPMPNSTREGAIRFLKSVSSGANDGLASYRPGELPSRPMTAEALVCRQFLGMARDNPAANEAGDYVLGDLPTKDKVNLYYWYYGTLGMYQLQGTHWQRWNQALQAALVDSQSTQGDTAGSWEPVCIWAGYGGRVYSTAMSALCLEVYYRFLPLYNSQTTTADRSPTGIAPGSRQ